jgi:trans-aconitate methyltransferase
MIPWLMWGCGTGMYSLDILKQVKLNKPILGIEPYRQMLEKIPADGHIDPILTDGLSFSKRPGSYDKILVKEAIHHIAERPELFANFYERLTPGGILLLVHVPPNVQYPLFQKALDRCLTWHADPNELTEQLQNAGFRVEHDALDFPHTIEKEHYFRMVAGCYMSALTSMSDEDLEEGLKEMEEKYKDETVLSFTDHFDYLTAIKE